MIIWNTPSGLLGNVTKGEPFNFALSCVGAETFSIIAGSLPLGLTLTGPFNQPTLPFPSIWGATSTNAITGTAFFTVRATDINGNISDKGFSLEVLDTQPSYVFPPSDLGTYADGVWFYASVAPLSAIPNWPTNMNIVSGSLPDQLSLNPLTGDITGYVNPSILYDSPFNQPNEETGKPNLPLSANSKSYSFTVQYDLYNSADYTFTIVRQDLFNNSNANISGPCYHDPIFLDASYDLNVCSSIFKRGLEGIPYYLEAIVWHGEDDWDSFTGTICGISSRQYIKKFPFKPKTFRINLRRELYDAKNPEHIGGEVISCGPGNMIYFLKDKNELNEVWEYYNKYNTNLKNE